MNCQECQRELLTEQPAEAARVHVATCACCAAFDRAQARFLAAGMSSTEPPASVDAQIRARARQAAFRAETFPAGDSRHGVVWRRCRWVAAAAAALVVLAVIVHWRPAFVPTPVSTPPLPEVAVARPADMPAMAWDDWALASALQQLETEVRLHAHQRAGGYGGATSVVQSIEQQLLDCEIELVFAGDES